MSWVQGMLDKFTTLAVSIFYLLVISMAVREMRERKLLGIIMLVISTGILGFLVLNPKDAIQKFSEFFN
jgi:hypothetical protein